MPEEKEETKLVSKTGTTALAGSIAGAVLIMFPRLLDYVSPDGAVQIAGAILMVVGGLAAYFRKVSSGNKTKIV